MATYTVYSSDYDPNCELCRTGHHQQKATLTNTILNSHNTMQTTTAHTMLPQTAKFASTQLSPAGQTKFINQQHLNGIQRNTSQVQMIDQLKLQQILQQQQQQQQVKVQTLYNPPPQQVIVQQAPQQAPPQQILYQQMVSHQPQLQQVSVVHNVEHTPVVHELHHIEKPIQVVGIDEVEAPWKMKVTGLEKQLIELELLIKKGGMQRRETKEVVREDTGRIRQLEDEIARIERDIRDKDDIARKMEEQLESLEEEFQNLESSGNSAQMADDLEKEKTKFVQLNRQYHNDQEELMMKQAELDSLKNKKIVVQQVTSTTTRQSGNQVRTSSHGMSSGMQKF